MFAFAIWDCRSHSLFLARDRFGIKPLYYSRFSGAKIQFASEIKPLIRAKGRRTEVNTASLYEYLLRGWSAQPETIFANIYQLPPGSFMFFDPIKAGGSVHVQRYWRLDLPGSQSELGYNADRVEELATEFDRAVSSHLVSDVEVGLLLSGGLDSSAIASSMARAVDPSSIRAFTVGFGLPDDEVPFARTTAAHCGITNIERIVDPRTFADEFLSSVRSLEEPIAHPVMQTTAQAAKLVSEHVKVALVGEGADELFAGYPHYRLFRPPYSYAPKSVLRRTALDVMCLMPDPTALSKLLMPELRNLTMLNDIAGLANAQLAEGPLHDSLLRYEIETAMVSNQLMRIDKLTMAHSIEARVPFLDRRFAELANSLPFGEKTRDGISKSIFRRAMHSRLPTTILNRPKSGKTGTQALLPLVMNQVAPGGALHHLVSSETLAARGWFDPKATRQWIDGAASPLVRLHPIESRRRAKFALALAVLEQWARIYLDDSRTVHTAQSGKVQATYRTASVAK
jgi:asparagine synthase (glutamine-hydrolysing)